LVSNLNGQAKDGNTRKLLVTRTEQGVSCARQFRSLCAHARDGAGRKVPWLEQWWWQSNHHDLHRRCAELFCVNRTVARRAFAA